MHITMHPSTPLLINRRQGMAQLTAIVAYASRRPAHAYAQASPVTCKYYRMPLLPPWLPCLTAPPATAATAADALLMCL